jgi:hypothetical protein
MKEKKGAGKPSGRYACTHRETSEDEDDDEDEDDWGQGPLGDRLLVGEHDLDAESPDDFLSLVGKSAVGDQDVDFS